MNPFEMLFGRDTVESLEKERETLLKKAYALETKWAKKLIQKKEYHEIKSAIQSKLVMVDFEKSIEQTLRKMDAMVHEAGTSGSGSGEKIHEILDNALDVAKVARGAKKYFHDNKSSAGKLQKALREANSRMLDLSDEAEKALHKMRSELAAEIMREARKKLRGIEEESPSEGQAVFAKHIEMPKREYEEMKRHLGSKHYHKKGRREN